VGLADRHSSICRASILGWVSGNKALINLILPELEIKSTFQPGRRFFQRTYISMPESQDGIWTRTSDSVRAADMQVLI